MRLALWFEERREIVEQNVALASENARLHVESAAAKDGQRRAVCAAQLAAGRNADLLYLNLELRAEVAVLRRRVEVLEIFTPSDLSELEKP